MSDRLLSALILLRVHITLDRGTRRRGREGEGERKGERLVHGRGLKLFVLEHLKMEDISAMSSVCA